MTFLGYFILAVGLFSLYIAFRIFGKLSRTKNATTGEGSILEKSLTLVFVGLLMMAINSITMVISYTFFWEKAYRAVTEEQYEAIVVGYEEDIVKEQNFRGSGYDDKVVFFPKVQYKTADGQEVIKKLDMASDQPPIMGQSLKITDKESRESANVAEVNWLIFILGSIFTGLGAFFACLLSTYATRYSFKRRIRLSIYCGWAMLLINIVCMILIATKQ